MEDRINSDCAVVVYARVPRPGEVKTRFIPVITPEEASLLYSCFIEIILEKVSSLEKIDLYLSVSPPCDDISYFQNLPYKFKIMSQKGALLGDRLSFTFSGLFKKGYKRIVVIGTDSPDMPDDFIRQAFLLLEEKDIVLGPAQDGGFYLVGLSKNISGIFDGIPWGTSEVFEKSVNNIKEAGLHSSFLPEWYDIDLPGDLLKISGIPIVDKILTRYHIV